MSSNRPILVVDDDGAIRRFLQLALSVEGYAVDSAPDGREALERVARTRPALILLDYKLRDMGAPTFAARYRATPGPHAPIVVLTATVDAAVAAHKTGADAFLPKPFDLDRLLDLVARYVGSAQAARH